MRKNNYYALADIGSRTEPGFYLTNKRNIIKVEYDDDAIQGMTVEEYIENNYKWLSGDETVAVLTEGEENDILAYIGSVEDEEKASELIAYGDAEGVAAILAKYGYGLKAFYYEGYYENYHCFVIFRITEEKDECEYVLEDIFKELTLIFDDEVYRYTKYNRFGDEIDSCSVFFKDKLGDNNILKYALEKEEKIIGQFGEEYENIESVIMQNKDLLGIKLVSDEMAIAIA